MIFFMMHKFLCKKPTLICFPSVHRGQTLCASLPLPKGQITSIPVDLAVQVAPCPTGVAQPDQWSYAAPATGLMWWFSRSQYTQVNYERAGCQQREIKVNLQLLITAKVVLWISWNLQHVFLGIVSCSRWEAVKTPAQHLLWRCSGFGLMVGCSTTNLSDWTKLSIHKVHIGKN